jgi:hypothetical protein
MMTIRTLAAALVAVTPILAATTGSAFANDQLRTQVGHEFTRNGVVATSAVDLDATELARTKLILNDGADADKRASLGPRAN